ncbi:MAG: metal-dependent transcriptional regulator, partial [Gammaproteobacteria bacterium]
MEDYLKSIYHLTSQGGFATTSDIAGMLEIAPPSVSGMMKRLSETGLIEHVPYRGVQLTPQGRRAALQMIRRHRILEVYLTQQLGYDWGDVHDEA